ncbi:hypothetical protein N6H14_03305 [Paenibacillus sp. CC-CFT747]|nr:hypothetical protein N6H14_03305 [Paenibacillus sp. CC-CFT747]
MQTDIPANELKQWILSFKKLKPEQIQFEHPGGIWDSPYLLMHQNELEDALRAYRAELGLPAESSSTGDLSKAVGVSGMNTGSDESDGENGGASSGAGEDNGSGQKTDADESGSRS